MDEDSPEYPPVGCGLNHPAILTFYEVFPPKEISADHFTTFLKKHSTSMGGEFISYDNVTGVWSIRVPHFTRYGLEDWDGVIEVAEECPEKVLHVTESVSKSTRELDVEEIRRIIKDLDSGSHSSHFTDHHIALLQNEYFVHTDFTTVKMDRLRYSFPPLIRANLLSLLYACHPLDEEESSFLVPQLHPPMGKELQQLVSQFHTMPIKGSSTRDESITSNRNAVSESSAPLETEYYSLFWELFEILFCEPLNGQQEYISTDPADFTPLQLDAVNRRRLHFSRWLDRLVRSTLWESYNDSSDVFGCAVQCLLHHDIWGACEILRGDCFERLAVQVAQISISEV